MNQSPDITVIIPFLNEEDNIERLGTELTRFTESKKDVQFEIILVNDGSTDRSIDVIKNTKFPQQTRVISFSQNYGSHAALRAGIMHSRGKNVTFLYADLQDPIDNISTMYAKQSEGNDIIWANRAGTQNSFFEKQFSKF